MGKLQATQKQIALVQLAVMAFFFAMRSCEYLKVPQPEQHRTDILRLGDIRFFKDGVEIGHESPHLEYSDCVSTTFRKQKKDEKDDTVTQMATGDRFFCPVRMKAALVRRIWSYPGANWETKVSAFWHNNKIEHITSADMINALNAACESYGWERLNLEKGDIGTHSIRSGAAMAMYLGDVPVYSIMMIGRWSSDAFLRYIRKQVEQFTHNVSRRMIIHQYFRHIPQANPRTTHL
jgi:hypothetical protein